MLENADEIASDEKVVEIELERLHPFRGHPFKVRDDPQMLNLIDSISKYGVMNPLIVRPLPEGVYEIIFFLSISPTFLFFFVHFFD